MLREVLIDEPQGTARLCSILDSFKIKFDYVNKQETEYFDIYDIKLSLGSKISKIQSIIEDISIQMNSFGMPNHYVVPSKGSYRIEIQKKKINPVSLEDLFFSTDDNFTTPICLGTDIKGNNLIKDLNTIPNLMIGGTTGSGKSVLLHNIILSLLSFGTEVYLADPKYVEFSMYEGAKGVKTIDNSVEDFKLTLCSLAILMDERYMKLKQYKCRNIKEFNSLSTEYMSPVVIVIDEWADLIMQDKTIQKDLCMIAQKGRAAGMGIVLATQRPSVNVLPGVIKANFPGRICLKVASAIDSKVILDQKGGESLVDAGTGLYMDGKTSTPIKFKTPFVKDISKYLERL
jgi:S-DNA-T family DNA segregation ATPase FtsK/SpoIIIE